jgi:transposase
MDYVGVDLHKETSWFYILDNTGKKVDSKNVANNLDNLKEYFSKIPRPFTLAVEATYNWYYFVDLAEQYAAKVFLANSFELKAFAKQHKKTDKIDAKLIATVLFKGFLPVVTIPNKPTRELREFLRYRVKIVTDRSRNISRLKSLLDKTGTAYEGDFTTKKALRAINTHDLPEMYARLTQKYCDLICWLNDKLAQAEIEMKNLIHFDADAKNLLSIPGIGPFSALLVKSEIIDIHRFPSFNRLCAYSGLAPRVSASANKIWFL